jgi:hypothetical protein
VLGVPEDGVGVEVGGGVEPERVAHLPAADAVVVHVGLDDVGLPRPVAQELEVQLVALRGGVDVGAHLQSRSRGGEHRVALALVASRRRMESSRRWRT